MSPRPKKPRRCCESRRPLGNIFKPVGSPITQLQQIEIEADEFEAMTLCDRDDLTQTEAGEQMGVSRGTVQRLVSSGRKKLISALQDGQVILIRPPH